MCVGMVEEGANRPVSQQGHVLDAVSAGDQARHQRAHLRPGVGALVGGQPQVLVGQRSETAPLSQPDDRDQTGAGHKIGVIEIRRRYRRGRM